MVINYWLIFSVTMIQFFCKFIFLSSKASDFVNGHVLYVDGGILATIGKPSNED